MITALNDTILPGQIIETVSNDDNIFTECSNDDTDVNSNTISTFTARSPDVTVELNENSNRWVTEVTDDVKSSKTVDVMNIEDVQE